LVALRRHVPRGLAVVTSRLSAIPGHVTFTTTPSARLWLPWIGDKNDLAGDPNRRRNHRHESHAHSAHTIVNTGCRADIPTKGEDPPIMGQTANNDRVRHFGQGFVDLDDNGLKIRVTNEHRGTSKLNDALFQQPVLGGPRDERHTPRTIRPAILYRLDFFSCNASVADSFENFLARHDGVH